MSTDMPDFLKAFFQGFSAKQLACTHLLSCQMPDGVYFCPSCKAKSQTPLNEKPGTRLPG